MGWGTNNPPNTGELPTKENVEDYVGNVVASTPSVLVPDYNEWITYTNIDFDTGYIFNKWDYGFLSLGGSVGDGWSVTVSINSATFDTGANGTGGAGTPYGIIFLPVSRGNRIMVYSSYRGNPASLIEFKIYRGKLV